MFPLPTTLRLAAAGIAVLAILGTLGGIALIVEHNAYARGAAAATATAAANVRRQEAQIQTVKEAAEQQMADVVAVLHKLQEKNQSAIAQIDDDAAKAVGADNVCLGPGIVRALDAIR